MWEFMSIFEMCALGLTNIHNQNFKLCLAFAKVLIIIQSCKNMFRYAYFHIHSIHQNSVGNDIRVI